MEKLCEIYCGKCSKILNTFLVLLNKATCVQNFRTFTVSVAFSGETAHSILQFLSKFLSCFTLDPIKSYYWLEVSKFCCDSWVMKAAHVKHRKPSQ